MPRTLVWFSCGAASAVAIKYAKLKYDDVEVLYCDTLAFEHPDNLRFMSDVEDWLGIRIRILQSKRYATIFDVFRGEKYIVGPRGAPCTRFLKRRVREAYQLPGDLHILGLTADEPERILQFERENEGILLDWVLRDFRVTKQDCYRILQEFGIELPVMYKLGYQNNNCIGCVKGGAGYWNKIRRDFPEAFNRMAKLERELGTCICRVEGKKYFLDELPEYVGRYADEDIECGVLCVPRKDK